VFNLACLKILGLGLTLMFQRLVSMKKYILYIYLSISFIKEKEPKMLGKRKYNMMHSVHIKGTFM